MSTHRTVHTCFRLAAGFNTAVLADLALLKNRFVAHYMS